MSEAFIRPKQVVISADQTVSAIPMLSYDELKTIIETPMGKAMYEQIESYMPVHSKIGYTIKKRK